MGVKLFCPRMLDIDAEIKNNPIPVGKGIHRDNLLYIIHSLIIRKAYLDSDQLKKLGKKGGYIPLSSKYLEKKISRYKSNIQYLLDIGIIEADNSYLTRNVSKGYRLKNPYTTKDFKETEITYLPLCRKIKKEKKLDKTNLAVKDYPYLAKWFQSGKLQINLKDAVNWIDKSEQLDCASVNNDQKAKKAGKAREVLKLQEKYSGFKILATRLANQDYYFSKDDFGNRLHTNLSNLPKELRNFLNYDGQLLVAIDIKNSQPYMSLPILAKDFWLSKTTPEKPTLLKIDKETYKDRKWDKYKRNIIIMFNNFSEILYSQDFQTSEFARNVIQGSFYEYLISVFEKSKLIKLGNTELEKRNKVKKMVLTLLFDNDNKDYNKDENSASQTFKAEFPNVVRVLKHVKEGGYRTLAMLLQKIESFLILSRICKRISKERPKVPLFTIHDCIVTTHGNENYVLSIMKDELQKSIGMSPKFSIDYWQTQGQRSVEAA